ncbi:Nucleolar protein 9, partial [Cryomyces antarcticus]
MPKENRKRGRREEEKKRKLENADDEPGQKRLKAAEEGEKDFVPLQVAGDEQDEATAASSGPGDMPFYGMLDEEEQGYFKRADEMLELNQFDNPEERSLFLASVFREAEGKELKIANSQSCSRLMERLVLLATPVQLKTLFQKFSGHFLHLIQHRFASHCCEALFIHSAPIVSLEVTAALESEDTKTENGGFVLSMENLFLSTIKELEGNLGYLMTERFASHTLRVLLIVLSGQPLEQSTTKSVLQSKRKEKIGVHGAEKPKDTALGKRIVPDSFSDALAKLITDSVLGLDTTYLRALATHPTGNPTLQLLLQLELTQFGKQRAKDENSIIHKLLPDDPIVEGTESASFINGLVYDAVGSRLLESIVEFAPGKLFKALYREFFKERIGSLARNEIAGYVVSKILERLSKEDLEVAVELINPQVANLAERNRTGVIRTLIERCAARRVDTQPTALQLELAYSTGGEFDIRNLLKMGRISPSKEEETRKDVNGANASQTAKSAPERAHGSLLAQSMILIPGALSGLIFESLVGLGPEPLMEIAKDPIASRTLQAALTSPNATIIHRRKLIQQLYGHIGELALDQSASYVVDAIWEGTHGLAFIRERIAEELAENEGAIRESTVGRKIWRNWKMDLYKRRRADWIKQSKNKAGNDGFQSLEDLDVQAPAPPKSSIQL